MQINASSLAGLPNLPPPPLGPSASHVQPMSPANFTANSWLDNILNTLSDFALQEHQGMPIKHYTGQLMYKSR